MSQYNKLCSFCIQEIEMSNASGKWLPYNLDGAPHDCRSSSSLPSSYPSSTPSSPSPPDTFATVATTTKEIEKEDDRPMNEEEFEIETNDPTIKALIKRITRMEEQIPELELRIDRLESSKTKPKPK